MSGKEVDICRAITHTKEFYGQHGEPKKVISAVTGHRDKLDKLIKLLLYP